MEGNWYYRQLMEMPNPLMTFRSHTHDKKDVVFQVRPSLCLPGITHAGRCLTKDIEVVCFCGKLFQIFAKDKLKH